jgi:hypothetical protein
MSQTEMGVETGSTDSSEIVSFQAYTDQKEPKVHIEINPDSFRPNRVSEAFARAIPRDLSNLIVNDIGAGSGVLSIIEAKRGAREVRAVEPADANYALLCRNIIRNNVQGIVTPYQGFYFDPIENLPKADIISADVSGIPETCARALGWYPKGIPSGGAKGSEITLGLLPRAGRHMQQNGKLYFPTANDLLDADEIFTLARQHFGRVENALCTPEQLTEWKRKPTGMFSPDYVWFPLRPEDMENLHTAYGGRLPFTMNIQTIRGRNFWRGQIYVASEPKIS